MIHLKYIIPNDHVIAVKLLSEGFAAVRPRSIGLFEKLPLIGTMDSYDHVYAIMHEEHSTRRQSGQLTLHAR